jgi:hypothetical protein
LFEESAFHEAQDSCVRFHIPDDAGSIAGTGYGLFVICSELDGPDPVGVLFHGSNHGLVLASDLPDTDLALYTTRNDILAVAGGADSGDTVNMCVVNYKPIF